MIELLCTYVTDTCAYVIQPLVVTASGNHPLLDVVATLVDWPGCISIIYAVTPSSQGWFPEAVTTRGWMIDLGNNVVIVASGNHLLLDSVAALVPWLISFSLHPTPFLPCDHARALRQIAIWVLQTTPRFKPHTAQLFAWQLRNIFWIVNPYFCKWSAFSSLNTVCDLSDVRNWVPNRN